MTTAFSCNDVSPGFGRFLPSSFVSLRFLSFPKVKIAIAKEILNCKWNQASKNSFKILTELAQWKHMLLGEILLISNVKINM